MIIIKIENLDKVKKAFEMFPVKMGQEVEIALKKSAFEVESESKKVTPVLSTRLRSSIIASDVRKTFVTISPHTDYMVLVHEGLGTNKRKGRRPYMEWGVASANSRIQKFFEEAVNNAIK